MNYLDYHRCFLLNIIQSSCIAENEALEMYRETFESNQATLEDMIESIGLINERIRVLGQEIRHFNSEQLKTKYVVFVNTDSSKLMRSQNVYSEAEVKLFECLLNEIAKRTEHCLTSIAALNLNASMKVTKIHSQELIDKWIDEGWFADVQDLLYLGPRGIVEFGAYLRVHYPDEVEACKLCKDPIFTGIKCADCETLLHKACLRKFLARMSNCPKCKKPWSVPV